MAQLHNRICVVFENVELIVEKIDTNQMPFLEFEMMKYFLIKTILNIYFSIRANVKKIF